MSRRLIVIAMLLAFAGPGAAQQPPTPSAPHLIVHEWGTFTSIAGQDGRAVEWLPLGAPPDLPCFVDRLSFLFKGDIRSLVRMETPVLYFYNPSDITVNVDVGFRQGYITEWFPRAAVTPQNINTPDLRRADFASRIRWSGVKVSPGANASLPTDGGGSSHYYVARHTDAVPLQVGKDTEKFLFYRGVGGFEPPLSSTVLRDGSVAVRNRDGAAVGDVIRFEHRAGGMASQVRHGSGSEMTFEPLSLDGEFVPPRIELLRILVAHGLYPKEAEAMVDTWRDSWFEEGSRFFYIVAPQAVDAILPLNITPAPSDVVRVFVGRMELGERSRMPQRMRAGTAAPAAAPASCR